MPKLKAKISGDNQLLAQFTLEHSATGKQNVRKGVKSATFDVVKGDKYVLLTEVLGGADQKGKKYKLEISGVTKANYPDKERKFKGPRELLGARITG